MKVMCSVLLVRVSCEKIIKTGKEIWREKEEEEHKMREIT